MFPSCKENSFFTEDEEEYLQEGPEHSQHQTHVTICPH